MMGFSLRLRKRETGSWTGQRGKQSCNAGPRAASANPSGTLERAAGVSLLGRDGQILTPLHQLVIVCGSPWGGHDLGPGNSLQQTQFLGLTPGSCLQLNTPRSWVASSLMKEM